MAPGLRRVPLGLRRMAWFVAIWLASVAVIGTIAWLIRLWIV